MTYELCNGDGWVCGYLLQPSLYILKGLVTGPPQIPKFKDAPVPYIKWVLSAHHVHPRCLWVLHPQTWMADCTLFPVFFVHV